MRKISLSPETLEVESFPVTGEKDARRGTVLANESEEFTWHVWTCAYYVTCAGYAGGDDTCYNTCEGFAQTCGRDCG